MTTPPLARRAVLGLGLGLTLPGLRAQSAPVAPSVRFLPAAEAAALISDDPGGTYFARMNLREIRARMRAPLPGLDVAAARDALRRFYATQTLAFSDEEQAMLRGIVERLQSRFTARAPLYARTPWSFIKLSDAAEGGMPHTRGPHVVLPAQVVAVLMRRERDAAAAGTRPDAPFGQNLLVHEQTHVLQRAAPARFEPLFTDVFGFVRAPAAPRSPWLDEHLVQNPDAPDLAWVFPLERLGGRGTITPATVLSDKPDARMPDDFQAVAVPLERDGAGWRVASAPVQPLSDVPGYDRSFPYADEDIHPNEIAAVTLAQWILRTDPELEKRPRIAEVGAWARTALA